MSRTYVIAALFTTFALNASAEYSIDEVPPYSVAMGILRNFNDSEEYCKHTGGRLPNRDEALAIYRSTVHPNLGTTSLQNFGGNDTTGSFWTTHRKGLFGCPVALIIASPEETTAPRIAFKTTCLKSPKLLAVCVMDRHPNEKEPARNTDQLPTAL